MIGIGRVPKNTPILERLLHYVEHDTNGGCWLWRGDLNRTGYGVFHTIEHGQWGARLSAHTGISPGHVSELLRNKYRTAVRP